LNRPVRLVWVAIAGAAGAAARYCVGRAFGVREFPWATLAINVTGSFLLGLVLGAATAREWPETATAAIGTGFLGAYTTFSTFSHETHTLLTSDRVGAAAGYVGASIAGGVAAAALGWALARSVA
jgi:CrcB protein